MTPEQMIDQLLDELVHDAAVIERAECIRTVNERAMMLARIAMHRLDADGIHWVLRMHSLVVDALRARG